MTPCTPVSWMQRSTSRKHWMFPLANTGMATALLRGAVRHSARWQAQPPLPSRVPATSPHRTALMCSQDAEPDRGPFCSLVRPCTVSSYDRRLAQPHTKPTGPSPLASVHQLPTQCLALSPCPQKTQVP